MGKFELAPAIDVRLEPIKETFVQSPAPPYVQIVELPPQRSHLYDIEAISLQLSGGGSTSASLRERILSRRLRLGSLLGQMASLLHRNIADNHVSVFNLSLAIY